MDPPEATGRDELAAVACGGCIYAMGGSHLVWPVTIRRRRGWCDAPGLGIPENQPLFSMDGLMLGERQPFFGCMLILGLKGFGGLHHVLFNECFGSRSKVLWIFLLLGIFAN